MKKTTLFLIMAMFVCTLSVNASSPTFCKRGDNVNLHPTSIKLIEYKGVVNVEFKMTIPKKFVGKKERYVFTPVLTDFNNVMPLESVVIDGSNFHKVKVKNKLDEVDYKDAISLLSSKEERMITYVESFKYEPWMENADLVCIQKLVNHKKSVIIAEDIHVKGVHVTTVAVPIVINEINLKTYISDESIFNFDMSSSVLNENIWNNMREIVKAKMLMKQIASLHNVTIEHINVTASSSPDGEMISNTELSHDRAMAMVTFIKDEFYLTQDQLNKIRVTHIDENWEGLKLLVEESDMKNKTNIIKTLNIDNLKERDRAMKSLPQYDYIKKVLLPQLRSAGIHVFYKISAEE